ncbi:helix-turn-helix transcriptional regulator [Methanolobus halotolerans]|uniref:Transcriptional regulator n=1 Tax=Methanolobus halotolerans TaxID=2052935 RepID=A0A4E0PZW5_9EURY|nr:winged helix-turn-helix domain-containing protein [Methanolobus halotolerans]TGC09525.1 transcriptional regulator [Methanolobus halotolerans]
MEKSTFIYSICASGIRKDILLLLLDGSKDKEIIQNHLNISIQALVSQLKILEENYLITTSNDSYTLTPMGKIIVREIIPTLNMINFFGNNIDYWGTHDLDFIPPHLAKRMNEFGSCSIIEVSLTNLYEADYSFIEQAKDTKFFYLITSFLFSNYKQIFRDLAENYVNSEVIISKDLHEKLTLEDEENFKYVCQLPNIRIHVHPTNFKLVSFTFSGRNFMFRLLTVEGDYDHKRVICASDHALKWGKELVEYYLKDSIPITEI